MIGESPHASYDWREDAWCTKHQIHYRKGNACPHCVEDAALLATLGIAIKAYNDEWFLRNEESEMLS